MPFPTVPRELLHSASEDQPILPGFVTQDAQKYHALFPYKLIATEISGEGFARDLRVYRKMDDGELVTVARVTCRSRDIDDERAPWLVSGYWTDESLVQTEGIIAQFQSFEIAVDYLKVAINGNWSEIVTMSRQAEVTQTRLRDEQLRQREQEEADRRRLRQEALREEERRIAAASSDAVEARLRINELRSSPLSNEPITAAALHSAASTFRWVGGSTPSGTVVSAPADYTVVFNSTPTAASATQPVVTETPARNPARITRRQR